MSTREALTKARQWALWFQCPIMIMEDAASR